MSVRDRKAGCLLGLSVGDALGTTNEFQTMEAPPLPKLAAGPLTTVQGGGPFRLAPGQVTDDTQMACCLARSIKRQKGFDVNDVARRYVEWRSVAFDIGGQTADSLAGVAQGLEPVEAGRQVWVSRGRSAAGNGSLMRTAPIGVLLGGQDRTRRRASMLDSAVTHFDPRCQLACAAFNEVIAGAIRFGAEASAERLLRVAEVELEAAAESLEKNWPAYRVEIVQAGSDLVADLEAARRTSPGLYSPELHLQRHQGFVRVAFRLAFWHLMHTGSFEAALIDTVNRGGDADTNGAIVGALLGARYGEPAIPEAWKATVLSALEGEEGPLAERYHPRTLLAQL